MDLHEGSHILLIFFLPIQHNLKQQQIFHQFDYIEQKSIVSTCYSIKIELLICLSKKPEPDIWYLNLTLKLFWLENLELSLQKKSLNFITSQTNCAFSFLVIISPFFLIGSRIIELDIASPNSTYKTAEKCSVIVITTCWH